MTTHDVDYHQEKFGKKEVLSKTEEDINSNESTMKRDFTQKVLTETAKPFRPPGGALSLNIFKNIIFSWTWKNNTWNRKCE